MRRILLALWLSVFFICFVDVGNAQNTQLSGTLSAPGGKPFDGYLYLTLTQDAMGLSSCANGPTLVLPQAPVLVQVTAGALVNPPKVWGADCLYPQAPYNIQIKDQQGNILVNDQWLIAGSNYNVGTAVSTNGQPPSLCGGFFACTNQTNTFLATQIFNSSGVDPLLTLNVSGVRAAAVNAAAQYEFPNTSGCPVNTPATGAVGYDSSAQSLCLFTLSGWTHIGGGGGGSGTVTSVAASLPLVATPSPIVNAGTLTCPTCVVSTSPGAGIAHFAGSTQAVTSSPVALGVDVSGNLPLANMASLGANVLLGTITAGVPAALSMPSCSASNNALTWTTGGGFGCNTITGGGGGGPTPSTTGITYWDNSLAAWATSYSTTGTGSTVVLSNSPIIAMPTITGGATFTGVNNGNISLTATGTPPGTPAANTVLVTVPNTVTAYTMTIPGAAPSINGSVASANLSGVENWVPLPVLTTPSAGNCFDSYDNSTGTYGVTACAGGGGGGGGTGINIQAAYTGGTLGSKLLSCLTIANVICDATAAVQANTALNGTAWSIGAGKITILVANSVPIGDTVRIEFGSTSALTGDYTAVSGTTGTAIVANTGSGLVSGTEVINVYPTLGTLPIEIARNSTQIVKWPPTGVVYAEEASTTLATPGNPTVTPSTSSGNLPATTYYYQGSFKSGNGHSASSAEQTVVLSGTGELSVTAPACPQYAVDYDWSVATTTGQERIQANIACGATYVFSQAALFPLTPTAPSTATSVPAIIMYNRNHPQMYAESGGNGGFTIRTISSFVGSNIVAMAGKGYSTFNNIGTYNYGHASGVVASTYDGGIFFASQRMNIGAVGTGGSSGSPTIGYLIEGVANDLNYFNLNALCQDTFCTPLVIQKVPSIDGDGEGQGRYFFVGGTAQSYSSSTSPLVVMKGINSNGQTTAPWNGGGLGAVVFSDFSMEGTNPSSCMTITDVNDLTVIGGYCQSNGYSGGGSTQAFVISSTGATSPDATYLTNTIRIDAATMGFNTIYQNNINSFSQTVANNFYPWTGAYDYGGGKHSIENWNSKALVSDSTASFNGITDSALSTGKLVGTTTGGLLQAITLGTGLSFSGSTLNASGGGISALTGDVTASGSGSVATTVVGLNGTNLAGLATGLLKNTTGTGVPSIAVATDIETLLAGLSGCGTSGNVLTALGSSTFNCQTPSGGGSLNVNGTPVSSPNLQDSASVTWGVSGSNIQATVSGGGTVDATVIGEAITGVDSGSVNTYVVTMTPALTSLVAGTTIKFVPLHNNTINDPTVNVDGLGAIQVVIAGGVNNLASGDIATTNFTNITYNGTYWVVNNPQVAGASFVALIPSAAQTISSGSNNFVPLIISGGGSAADAFEVFSNGVLTFWVDSSSGVHIRNGATFLGGGININASGPFVSGNQIVGANIAINSTGSQLDLMAGNGDVNLRPSSGHVVNINGPAANNVSQTTVSCSSSGTAIFSQPDQGASDKRVVIHLSACLGTASYTFPTAFSNSPSVYASNNIAAGIATSVSSSAVTVTGTTTTGSLILEDY